MCGILGSRNGCYEDCFSNKNTATRTSSALNNVCSRQNIVNIHYYEVIYPGGRF